VNTWRLDDGTQFQHVHYRIMDVARAAKGKLQRRSPELSRVWVEWVILLSADNVDMRIEDQLIHYHVFRLSECIPHFVNYRGHGTKNLSQAQRDLIVECLAGRGVLDDLRQTNDRVTFVNLRGNGDFERTYYSDLDPMIYLNAAQLRGAMPSSAVRRLRPHGCILEFSDHTYDIVVMAESPEVRLNNRVVRLGERAQLRDDNSHLSIGEIKLTVRLGQVKIASSERA
jgi:hypothetical protein